MKVLSVEVKREGNVVATIDVPQYETLAEAIEASNETDVLSDYNRQVKTDLSNRARVAAAEQSIESQIARIARASKKGNVSKSDAKAQLAALLAQLTGDDDEATGAAAE